MGTDALGIHETDQCLCRGEILFGRFFEPFFRGGEILFDAIALTVEHAEKSLRVGTVLHGRFLIPFFRFFIILRYSEPFLVHQAETGLCLGIALAGGTHQKRSGLFVSLAVIQADTFGQFFRCDRSRYERKHAAHECQTGHPPCERGRNGNRANHFLFFHQ